MYRHFFKRFFDILVSLIALPFVLLVIAACASLIYFTDKGPVFYNAPRYGRNGKVFTMYKLRSMYVNAPDIRNADGSTYNGERDPRVTKIGRIMRKTSLDEFPQFLNVLKGDMSLIGPRPILTGVPYEELSDERQKCLSVRPGVTGYVQAYYRNSIGQEEKMRHACYYVDNITFLLDVKILLQTAKSVLKRENIYVKPEMPQEEPVKVE